MKLQSTSWKAEKAKAEIPRFRFCSHLAFPRLTPVTDPRGGVTTYGYDLAGNQTSVTDSDGNQTTYAYYSGQ